MRSKDLAGKKRFSSDFVSLRLHTQSTAIAEKRYALWERFLELIVCEKEFTPERYDRFDEPPKNVFDCRDISEPIKILSLLGEKPIFERYKPYYLFYNLNTGHINPAAPINFEGLTVEAEYFKSYEKCEQFLNFSKKMYWIFNPLYGYIAQDYDRNNQNRIYTYFPPGHPNAGSVASMKGFGGDIRKGIPGVYWANFFSKIYIDTIGRDKFLTAPCYRREELSGGGFLLLTSESPLDWQKPEVQELRKAMREHLGYEYFCDINNRDRICKVPEFDFSVWEKECDYGMKIPERLKISPQT